MSARSDAYQRFVESVRGGIEWKDFLDLPAYREAPPSEQTELDALLMERARSGDARATNAIADLWPADRAFSSLLEIARHADPTARVSAATVLYELAFLEALATHRAVLFNESASEDDRVAAVSALAHMHGADVDASLHAALEDAAPSVRDRAKRALDDRR